VHQGQVWANGAQLDSVLNAFVEAAPLRVDQQKPKLLTRREEGVVALIAEGLSNREVGQKLGLTEHTVGNYLFRIYDKIGISSRVELVLYWLKTR
jgi:DNA-binding NarL/FixJ family response regulator